MKNKKGFTLVELVIVIAVIAILAGVMIGTFASVVKKAKESAKMQEMANQKQQQMIDDIDAKLKDDAWLGWEDFETKLAEAVTKAIASGDDKTVNAEQVKTATNEAVEAAFAKYASSLATGKTALTEEQVKYIVESALAKNSYTGITEAQVKAIVNNATSGLSNLSSGQVKTIVSQIVNAASEESKLTLSQINVAVQDLAKTVAANKPLSNEDVTAAINKAMKEYGTSTLGEADIERLLAKYVTNGTVKGDYKWYDANSTSMKVDSADQLIALSTLAKGGTSFAGKTVTVAGKITVEADGGFQPIIDFDGVLKGEANSEITYDMTPVWNTMDDRNGKTMMNYMATYQEKGVDVQKRKDAVAYGFVASLKEGGVVENINLVLETDFSDKDPGSVYTYFGGLVGFLDGGTIRNCTVKGTVKGYGRIGGVVGWAKSGTIENVSVESLTIDTKGTSADNIGARYTANSEFAAYVSGGEVVFKNCKAANFTYTNNADSGFGDSESADHFKYGYFVGQFNDTKKGEFTEATKIVLIGCTINNGTALNDAGTTWTTLVDSTLKSTKDTVGAIGASTTHSNTGFEIKEK